MKPPLLVPWRRAVVLVLVAAVLGAGVVLGLGILHQRGAVGELREAFSAASGRKILLNVSPTCPVCNGVVDELQRALATDGDAQLRVFVVYSRFLRWDRLGVWRTRVHDSRVTQLWDSDGLVAAELCRAPASTALCAVSPRLFGAVLWFEPGAPWRSAPAWEGFDELPQGLGK